MRTLSKFNVVYEELMWFTKFHDKHAWLVPTERNYTMEKHITHTEFQKDYSAGFEACALELKSMTVESVRDKFNLDFPNDWKPSNMACWYYSKGFIDCLLKAF